MSPLQNEEVLSPRDPRRHHATGRVLRRCGAGVWVFIVRTGVGTLVHLGYSMPWIHCTASACYNNILQWGCPLIAWWQCRPPW